MQKRLAAHYFLFFCCLNKGSIHSMSSFFFLQHSTNCTSDHESRSVDTKFLYIFQVRHYFPREAFSRQASLFYFLFLDSSQGYYRCVSFLIVTYDLYVSLLGCKFFKGKVTSALFPYTSFRIACVTQILLKTKSV